MLGLSGMPLGPKTAKTKELQKVLLGQDPKGVLAGPGTARNPKGPQNQPFCHQMGRRATILDMETAPRRRIAARFSQWGSRPLNLNFFLTHFGPQKWENAIFVNFSKLRRTTTGGLGAHGAPWGPYGAHGAPSDRGGSVLRFAAWQFLRRIRSRIMQKFGHQIKDHHHHNLLIPPGAPPLKF